MKIIHLLICKIDSRRNLIFNSIKFVLLLVSFGCTSHFKPKIIVNIFNSTDSCLILKNWYVVGPFQTKGYNNHLDNDNLNFLGYREKNVSLDDFFKIDTITIKNKSILNKNFKTIYYSSEKDIVNINEIIDSSQYFLNANAYLGCIIRSTKESELRLNFSSDNGAKVWLNNKLILNNDKEISVFNYEKYIPIKLRKGDNFLLVKVFNSSGEWLMYSRIEKESENGIKRHQKIITHLNNHDFFKSSVIDTVKYLEANINLPFNSYKLIILNSNNNEVFNDTVIVTEGWKKDISFLGDGLYNTKLILHSDTLEQIIFKGNIIDNINSVIEKIGINVAQADKIDLEANILRYKHLIDNNNRGSNISSKQLWQRKMIYLYRDLSTILNSKSSLKYSSGFHIRSYISEIDNQPQYYIIHLPDGYKKHENYPLVFQIPFKVTYNNHYLKSMRVADLPLIENLQDITNKNKIILVEPFAREVGIPNFNNIEESDFFEVLNSICKDYNINKDQLYFIGSCQGAYKALKLAVKYPDLLAGMAFISPSFYDPYNYVSKNPWIEIGEPMKYLKNIQNIPICIIHSKIDNHVPQVIVEDFINKYKAEGMLNLTYISLEDVIDQYYWSEYSDDLVKFLLKYKRVQKPQKITISTPNLKGSKINWLKILQFDSTGIANISAEISKDNIIKITSSNVSCYSIDIKGLPYNKSKEISLIEDDKLYFKGFPKEKELKIYKNRVNSKIIKTTKIEGPFLDVFNHKFILVDGTKGSMKENLMLKQLGDTIEKMWNYKYWNNCSRKSDIDITTDDITKSNLVILGTDLSNIFLKKIILKLPIHIKKDAIVVKNTTIKGDKLGYYMIYPNPLNPQKYIAIIGYNNPNYISLGSPDLNEDDYTGYNKWLKLKYMEISCYGWYDYKVWDNTNKRTLKKGYFSPQWN